MNIKESHECAQLAHNIDLLRWAKEEVEKPHANEIIIPPQFGREDALHALEMAVIHKYSFPPAVLMGQGRDARDWSEWELWAVIVGVFAAAMGAIFVLAWWLL